MANPVINIRDTGRNSAKTADVRGLADNSVNSWTSGTTGTIAVTADATYDVSFTQPADTIIRSLIAIPAGNIVTAGASGDDVDFDLGTAAGGGALCRHEQGAAHDNFDLPATAGQRPRAHVSHVEFSRQPYHPQRSRHPAAKYVGARPNQG